MSKEIQSIIDEFKSLRKEDKNTSNENLMMGILSRRGSLPYKDIDNEEHDFMLKSNIIRAQFYLSLLTKPFEEVVLFYGAWEDNKGAIEENAERYLASEKKVKSLVI